MTGMEGLLETLLGTADTIPSTAGAGDLLRCNITYVGWVSTIRPHMNGMYAPTTLERAFVLACSGAFASVGEIRQALKRERFDQVEAHLAGSSINKQLRALCEAARRSPPAA